MESLSGSSDRIALADVVARIAAHRPVLAPAPEGDGWQAAVSLVFCEPRPGLVELLFIERATKVGDPWSGHMAFPGGRRDPRDPDLAATAARETSEEVGLALGPPIGRLDDLVGTRNPRVPPIVVAPYVFLASARPVLTPNVEVESTVWIPLDWIAHPDSSYEYRFEREQFTGTFPAIRFERYTVWGLTYRILSNLFEILGRAL